MTDAEPAAQECLPPDDFDLFYKQAGQDLLKGELPFLRDVLSKLVTLDTALLGGGLILLKEASLHPGLRVAVILCFLVSLASAFVGLLPFEGPVSLIDPEQNYETITRGVRRKGLCLWFAAGSLCLGFLLALAGMAIKQFWG